MRHQPGETIDHYEIVEALGEGAYAETYKARDSRTGDVVVLKCPDPHTFADPQIYQRFQRETKIARGLEHPGVQRSLGACDGNGEPYLVLEYIQGKTLRAREHEAGGPVPVGDAVGWGRQIAGALAYLHGQGIAHRDLKPENVLIADDGGVKIADFGTALVAGARRLTWRNLTESVGTPDYMSPEQIQGGRGDARSDIYAWGCIMYELLAGDVPFAGDNWMVVMAGHLQRNPERISKKRKDVPPSLEAVVLKAMRRNPANRYQSAEDLLGDLGRLDSLDPAAFDLSPEPAMGGMSAAPGAGTLLLRLALIMLGFFLLLAIVIAISLWLKR